jgi:hypothetical protein
MAQLLLRRKTKSIENVKYFMSLWILFKIFFALIIYKRLTGNARDMRTKYYDNQVKFQIIMPNFNQT